MVFMTSLDGQLLAPLGAATGEYGTTALGGHASTEAMRLGTLPLVGLIRTLHCKPSWDTRKTNVSKP